MPRFRFENFTVANGLPDDHVFNVLVDGDRIWAATENGLGSVLNGKWKTYTTKDGLAHRRCYRLRWTSARATCGPEPWVG